MSFKILAPSAEMRALLGGHHARAPPPPPPLPSATTAAASATAAAPHAARSQHAPRDARRRSSVSRQLWVHPPSTPGSTRQPTPASNNASRPPPRLPRSEYGPAGVRSEDFGAPSTGAGASVSFRRHGKAPGTANRRHAYSVSSSVSSGPEGTFGHGAILPGGDTYDGQLRPWLKTRGRGPAAVRARVGMSPPRSQEDTTAHGSHGFPTAPGVRDGNGGTAAYGGTGAGRGPGAGTARPGAGAAVGSGRAGAGGGVSLGGFMSPDMQPNKPRPKPRAAQPGEPKPAGATSRWDPSRGIDNVPSKRRFTATELPGGRYQPENRDESLRYFGGQPRKVGSIDTAHAIIQQGKSSRDVHEALSPRKLTHAATLNHPTQSPRRHPSMGAIPRPAAWSPHRGVLVKKTNTDHCPIVPIHADVGRGNPVPATLAQRQRMRKLVAIHGSSVFAHLHDAPDTGSGGGESDVRTAGLSSDTLTGHGVARGRSTASSGASSNFSHAEHVWPSSADAMGVQPTSPAMHGDTGVGGSGSGSGSGSGNGTGASIGSGDARQSYHHQHSSRSHIPHRRPDSSRAFPSYGVDREGRTPMQRMTQGRGGRSRDDGGFSVSGKPHATRRRARGKYYPQDHVDSVLKQQHSDGRSVGARSVGGRVGGGSAARDASSVFGGVVAFDDGGARSAMLGPGVRILPNGGVDIVSRQQYEAQRRALAAQLQREFKDRSPGHSYTTAGRLVHEREQAEAARAAEVAASTHTRRKDGANAAMRGKRHVEGAAPGSARRFRTADILPPGTQQPVRLKRRLRAGRERTALYP